VRCTNKATGALLAQGRGGSITVNVAPAQNVLCVITNETGTLTVVKDVVPNGSAGRFNLLIDGVVEAANVGDNGSVTRSVPLGRHTVGEAADTGTNLTRYQTSIVCKDATGTVRAFGPGTSIPVSIATGQAMTCTIRNVATPCSGPIVQRRSATAEWSARVVLPTSPDAELFRFGAQFTYCFDGTTAEVERGAAFGSVDAGLDTAVLAALGFELEYDPSEEFITFSRNTGRATGDFEFIFDSTVLIDKLGLRDRAQKILVDKLGKRLSKIIERHGYEDEFAFAVADAAAEISHNISAAFLKQLNKLDKVLPGAAATYVRDYVMDKVDGALEEWRNSVTVALSSDQFVNKTADEIGSALFDGLFEIIRSKLIFEFSVWTPEATLTVSPSGTPSWSIGGFNNLQLTIRRER
jgi:hypothetical protein